MADTASNSSKYTTKLKLALDPRLVIAILLSAIIIMFVIWKPWSVTTGTRTVQVSGEATVKAEPDEYVFYPSYNFVNVDKAAALAELTKKSDEVVAALKKLGLNDSQIKSNSSGYNFPIYYNDNDSKDATYTLQLTITVSDREMAQKAQDYLVTTSPTGSVSPQATFSESKRKKLESQARDSATTEARSKADQLAKNLGFKVGKVKDLSDGSLGGAGCSGYVCPMAASLSLDSSTKSSAPELSVQPGENELNYSVSVTYYIH